MIKTPFWPVPLGAKPIDLGLERIKILMQRLGVTEHDLPPIVHVAGTNGKGSTIAFLRAFLEEAGYSVHVYTSPHLVYFNERIVLAGKIISDDFLNAVLTECKEAAEGLPITFFEGTTAAAFLAFSKVKADILLLETGLGGRLDATNIIDKPALTIITPISLDHMAYLGNSIKEIAGEKAAIIKPGIPCISGNQKKEAAEVIKAEAKKKGSEIFDIWRIEKNETVTPAQAGVWPSPDTGIRRYDKSFKYISNTKTLELPSPALPGDHQLENAGTAIAALEKLPDFMVSEKHIIAGLKSVKWPARLQRLPAKPGIELWLDGGHNRAGGEILGAWLQQKKSGGAKKIYLVCAMLKDKEAEAFLKSFVNLADKLYAVPIPGEEKSYSPQEIAGIAGNIGIKSQTMESVDAAIQEISSGGAALILICGSLYLAGAVLEQNG